jgi:hypothetical protein
MSLLPLSGYEPIFSSYLWESPKYINACNCYDYALADCHQRFDKTSPGDNSRRFAHKNMFDGLFCPDGKCPKRIKDTFKQQFIERVLADNKGNVKTWSSDVKCDPGWYKVMGFVSYGPEQDFHWFRQNKAVRYRCRQGDTVEKVAKMFNVRNEIVRQSLTSPLDIRGPYDGEFTDIEKLNNKSKSNYSDFIIEIPCNIWSHKRGWGEGPLVTDASGKLIINPINANTNYPESDLNYEFIETFAVKSGKVHTGTPGKHAPILNFGRGLNKRLLSPNLRKYRVPR